jgi:putative transposase
MRYAAIHQLRRAHAVGALCRALGVPASSYHAWCASAARRAVPGEGASETTLIAALTAAHRASRGSYGRPRLTRELKGQGFAIGERRVATWQRRLGLWGKRRGAKRPGRRPASARAPAPNVLARAFQVGSPNERWASDTTWISTREGPLALAITMDLGSRRLVGWATSPTLDHHLTRLALARALAQRVVRPGLLHHADLGSEYVAQRYCDDLAAAQISLSFSRPGNCRDNAVVESFFATLKTECVPATPGGFATHASAIIHLFDYIEVFYNHHRRHSTLDFMSPADYEAQYNTYDSA